MSDSTQTAGLLPFECYYENSGGEVIRFDQPPMMIRSSELFDYQWRLTTFDRAMHDGGKVVFARRPVQDKTLSVDVFAETQEAHNAALNRLHDVLDYDVRRLTPGKLWVNGQYIRCLAFASIKTLDRDWTRYTVVKLSLRVVSPAWVEEHSVVLMPAEETADDNLNKRYPGRYPYRYADDDAAYRFLNDTGAPLPMILRFFGPCRNPSVFVGGNEYSLETETPDGTYIVLDQMEKSIWCVAQDGTRDNLFDCRKKTNDIFLPAPAGSLSIACVGCLSCEVVFLVQRSEPRWS